MKHRFYYSLIAWCLLASAALADDIDLYLPPMETPPTLYLALLLERSSALEGTACFYAQDCLPPYMSEAAYAALPALASGMPVTRREVLKAVFSSLLARPEFAAVRPALFSTDSQGTPLLLAGHDSERHSLLDRLGTPVTPGSDWRPLQLLDEWYRYLGGGVPSVPAPGPIPAPGPEVVEGGRYVPPVLADSACPRLFSLTIGDTVTPVAGEALLPPDLAVLTGGGQISSLPDALAALQDEALDWLPALAGTQPLVASWRLALTRGELAGWPWQGFSLAEPAALERELAARLGLALERRAVRSLPAVNNGLAGALLSSGALYLPQFQPAPTLPWRGNLKKLRLANASGAGPLDVGAVVDARGDAALQDSGAGKGSLRPDALTLWTRPEELSAPALSIQPPGADGAVVARGGAGQNIPGYLRHGTGPGEYHTAGVGRQVYVSPPDPRHGEGAAIPMDPALAVDPAFRAALGAAAVEEAAELIRWARGLDVDDLDADGDTSEARHWLMGEVLHSRPVSVNYGATPGYSLERPNVRLVFGSGDGALHIVQDRDGAGRESGRERYLVYLRELLGRLAARRQGGLSATRADYGVDGRPVLFTHDDNNDGTLDYRTGDLALVIVGLRRGGRSYYAFDISDPDSPPRLRWRLDPSSPGFGDLGLTFSTPVLGRVRHEGGTLDVAVFGGGYDGGWTADGKERRGKDAGRGEDERGAAIYVVDVRTGERVWSATGGSRLERGATRFSHPALRHGIAAPLAALRTPSGELSRLYVGDTGGQVWRIDLPPGDGPDHRERHWSVRLLAELSLPGAAGDRRFFQAADIVRSRDAQGDFEGVLLLSGNRARPTETTATNGLFYLKDRSPETRDTPLNIAGLADMSACRQGSEAACDQAGPEGWWLPLSNPGEKGLAPVRVARGRIYATTWSPPEPGTDPCNPGPGRSRLYILKLADASAVGPSRAAELGAGPAAAVGILDTQLLLPTAPQWSGALENAILTPCEGALCRGPGGRALPLYWRDLLADED